MFRFHSVPTKNCQKRLDFVVLKTPVSNLTYNSKHINLFSFIKISFEIQK